MLTTSAAITSPSTSSAMMSSGLPGLHDLLQQRQQCVDAGQLVLADEDERVLHFHQHAVAIGDETGRDVAAVELNTLDELEFVLQPRPFLDQDDAVVADLLHRVGDGASDLQIAVGGDGADLGDLDVRGDSPGALPELGDDRFDRAIHAAFQIHRDSCRRPLPWRRS